MLSDCDFAGIARHQDSLNAEAHAAAEMFNALPTMLMS
jgi:hypothetical protein